MPAPRHRRLRSRPLRVRFHYRLRTLLIAAAILPAVIGLLAIYFPRLTRLVGPTIVPLALVLGTILFALIYNTLLMVERKPSERWKSVLGRDKPTAGPPASPSDTALGKKREALRKQIANAVDGHDGE